MTPSRTTFPISDHCNGDLFFNPGVDTDKSLRDLLRWRRTSQRSLWPARRENRSYPPPPARVEPGTVGVTFVGHATFLLTTAAGTILTDPFFSERASPIPWAGPKRVRRPGLALGNLPAIDLILLSHNHYDHMDLESLRALRARPTRTGKPVPVVTGLGNARYLAQRGIDGAIELDWWDTTSPVEGLTVTFTPAQH